MYKLLQYKKGFTLVEMLVVVAIIGVLSTTMIVSIDGFKQIRKAQTGKLVTQFNQIEKAFRLVYLDEGRTSWWREDELNLRPKPYFKENNK